MCEKAIDCSVIWKIIPIFAPSFPSWYRHVYFGRRQKNNQCLEFSIECGSVIIISLLKWSEEPTYLIRHSLMAASMRAASSGSSAQQPASFSNNRSFSSSLNGGGGGVGASSKPVITPHSNINQVYKTIACNPSQHRLRYTGQKTSIITMFVLVMRVFLPRLSKWYAWYWKVLIKPTILFTQIIRSKTMLSRY